MMGLGLGTLLGLIFVVSKLTHLVDWSWWLVLAPFAIDFALAIAAFIYGIKFFGSNMKKMRGGWGE